MPGIAIIGTGMGVGPNRVTPIHTLLIPASNPPKYPFPQSGIPCVSSAIDNPTCRV